MLLWKEGVMSRPKDKTPSKRIRIDGYLKRGVDPQIDVLLDWLDQLPAGKRFPMVMQRLMMGGVLEAVVEDGDVEKAREAASAIMSAFVTEDDDG
jgi:hypothetical protein